MAREIARHQQNSLHLPYLQIAIKKGRFPTAFFDYYSLHLLYPKNEINTPAATAEPITPEILLDIQ